MKTLALVISAILSAPVFAETAHKAVVPQGSTPVVSGEAWKGAPYNHDFDFHAGIGLGLFEGNAGLAFLVGGAVEVAHEGFVGDGINDQVYVEATTGPLILSTVVDPWVYSLHLRWDFHMDLDWTVFAVGGFSGSFGTGLGRFFPRFGAGFVKHFSDNFGIRGELSHEWTTLGVTFGF